jgi:hypothetical protein
MPARRSHNSNKKSKERFLALKSQRLTYVNQLRGGYSTQGFEIVSLTKYLQTRLYASRVVGS